MPPKNHPPIINLPVLAMIHKSMKKIKVTQNSILETSTSESEALEIQFTIRLSTIGSIIAAEILYTITMEIIFITGNKSIKSIIISPRTPKAFLSRSA